jgi:DNA-binding transcriptional LysR family regulator
MAGRAGRGELGSLAVGFVGSATYTVVPKMIREYRERFPEVELTMKEMSTAEQARALDDGLIGVGFVRPPVGGDGDYLGVRVVLEEPLVAALPASHRLANAGGVRLADLAGEPFVVLYPRRLGLSFYDLAVGAYRGAGFEPRVAQEAAHMQTIVGLVAAGAGVSLVPASVAKHGGEEVAYGPLEDGAPPARIAAAWRLGNPSHTVGAFLRVVEEFV